MGPINFNLYLSLHNSNQINDLLSILHIQMTHLSRSDGDKMLSDMAENGSADYNDQDGGYGSYDDDDDLSGSGDLPCKFP